MSPTFTRLFALIVFLSFKLQGRHASMDVDKKNRFVKLSRELVYDMERKALTVWGLKEDFSKYKTFSVGEIVFTIRTKFAVMVRVLMNAELRAGGWTVTEMIRNITNLQKMAQELYIFQDELIKFDNSAQYGAGTSNLKRFQPGASCQVAGTMYMPPSIMRPKIRRMLESRSIMKTLKKKEAVKPSVYVAENLAQSLPLNIPGARPGTDHPNTEFINMAPDL